MTKGDTNHVIGLLCQNWNIQFDKLKHLVFAMKPSVINLIKLTKDPKRYDRRLF
jgi:hypothetical protein